jgi:3-deoxy-7-phosphoheptulonate synthase
MIVVMEPGTSEKVIEEISERLINLGYKIHRSTGENRTVLGVVGRPREGIAASLQATPGVEKVIPISRPFKMACREFNPVNTVIPLGEDGLTIGAGEIVMMAGPCAVEGEEQLLEVAGILKNAGARVLRGGAFKPRTSPYSFQGMEEEGLKLLKKVRDKTGLLIVSEVVDPINVGMVEEYVDILQVGTRNMQNFYLLKELGRVKKPVMLKRGMSATIEEWLMAAEYIISGGNEKVILCERGIRTFETYTRNTLDISAIPVVKELSHLPVIVDPSHGTGRWQLVPAMSMAAIAAGADGLLVEVHPCPEKALSDGPQSLNPENFAAMMESLREVAGCVGKRL